MLSFVAIVYTEEKEETVVGFFEKIWQCLTKRNFIAYTKVNLNKILYS